MKTSLSFKMNRPSIYLCAIIATLSVFTLSSCLKDTGDNNNTIVSALTVIHAAPDTPPIDFVLDNQLINNQEFAYGNRINYFRAYSGNRLVRFYESGTTSNALYEKAINLAQGKYFSLFLAGTTTDSLSSLLIQDDLSSPADGKAKIRFINLSPNAGSLDFQIVSDSLIASNKGFKQYTDFQEVAAGEYNAAISSHSDGTIDRQFDITLEDGKIYTVWARGLVPEPPTIPEHQFGHGIILHDF